MMWCTSCRRALRCGGGRVQRLRDRADDPAFQAQWQDVKAVAKQTAMARITALTGVQLPPNALLDVQVCPPPLCMHACQNICFPGPRHNNP